MDNNISLSKEDECQRICTLQYKHFFREISQKLLLKSATFCSKGQFETQFWTIKVGHLLSEFCRNSDSIHIRYDDSDTLLLKLLSKMRSLVSTSIPTVEDQP